LQPKNLKEKMQNTLEKMQQVYWCTYARVAEPKPGYRINKKTVPKKLK